MSSEPVIRLENLGKCYQIYDQPRDRLLQMLFRGKRRYYREFWALRNISLKICRGEVVGVVGRNGAGKSTLLQLICGVLAPSTGDIVVRGRVAALLELGAGFNPEFTGRENLSLSCAVMGLSAKEIEAKYDEIVSFSGIGDFIDQPVKTYSSGMYVRLAFSVATRVDPDILVIDEALSVGDGEFARKSFDRIMSLKQQGATILFCSHSLYQVEAFCDRALWLERGEMRMLDSVSKVTSAYQATLDAEITAPLISAAIEKMAEGGRILKVTGSVDGVEGLALFAHSMQSALTIAVDFLMAPGLPAPSVAIGVANEAGITVTSACSAQDRFDVKVDSSGRGKVKILFPQLLLLKGSYFISVVLACERALHPYDIAKHCLSLQVVQKSLLQGIVELPHEWRIGF